MIPIKGQIYYVHLHGEGSQQTGVRPAVVVQSNFLNSLNLHTTVVCPLTSKTRHLKTQPIIKPTEQNGLKIDSAVMAEQVVAVNKSHLERMLGTLGPEDVKRVEEALLIVFDIS